ncbi:Protein yellow [Cytospora mali]|uniref:Protein yellow n=1 Tax=Cytospora mali TaxID=578113 RepID=A0A194VGJ0_CYTMA|nr:Protein yellow [Valsa mali var. pyri (nom. inval.)]
MCSRQFLTAAAAAAATIFAPPCLAATDARVQAALALDTPCNGVSTTPDGRLFVLYARVDGTQAQGLPEVVEWVNGTGVPYPDARWNSYAAGADPAVTLVHVNSQRVGPDGSLWLVDTGTPGFGAPVILPEGPKLVVVDTVADTVSRVYHMGNVTKSDSLLDDIRFNWAAGKAYLTDAGVGALIVLDLETGRAVRLLEGHLSVQAFTPASGEGKYLRKTGRTGSSPSSFSYMYADQLEVSPDARYLYYQPASGGMSRIETARLDEAFYNSSAASLDVLGGHVEPFALTPGTGGTAIDAEGSLYVSDTDRQAVEKVYANGTRATLVRDERLLWVDAMWIDGMGRLWMPAAQLNRGVPFSTSGESGIVKPLYVFLIDIGVGPSPIDHE